MEPTIATSGLLAFLAQLFSPLLLCSSIPLGSPPMQDPALGRVAPRECVLYVGWAGIGVPDPNSRNRAERFLADPEVRHMRAEAARRFRLLCKSHFALLGSTPLGLLGIDRLPPELAADVAAWSEWFATQPCAFFISRYGFDEKTQANQCDGGFVMNVGDSPERVAAMLQHYKKMTAGAILEEAVAGQPEFRLKDDTDFHLRWALRAGILSTHRTTRFAGQWRGRLMFVIRRRGPAPELVLRPPACFRLNVQRPRACSAMSEGTKTWS